MNQTSTKIIGIKAKKLRELRNLSQTQMAHNLGITQSTYCRYEAGSVTIPPDTQAKIAFILGLSFESFQNFEVDKLFTFIEKMYWIEK